MKSDEIPLKLFAHCNEDDGGWIYGKRRKEPEDHRFPHVSEDDAEILRRIATSAPTTTLSKDERRLIRRLAGLGGP